MTSPNERMQPTGPAWRRSRLAVSRAGPAADPDVQPPPSWTVAVQGGTDGDSAAVGTWRPLAKCATESRAAWPLPVADVGRAQTTTEAAERPSSAQLPGR